jgi:hypothetical protein
VRLRMQRMGRNAVSGSFSGQSDLNRYHSTNSHPKLLVLKPKWKVQDFSGKPYGFNKPSA